MHANARHAVAFVLASSLAACSLQPAAEEPADDPDRPTRSAPSFATLPPSEEPVTGEVPSDILDRIVADAAERTGVAEDAIEVVQGESVTWNDGSLGCPEPGMLYTQALVDGYQVILEAADEQLDYRVTADGSFRLCEDGGPPSGG